MPYMYRISHFQKSQHGECVPQSNKTSEYRDIRYTQTLKGSERIQVTSLYHTQENFRIT